MSIYRRPGSDNWWLSVSIAGRKTRRTTGTADRAKAEEFEQRKAELEAISSKLSREVFRYLAHFESQLGVIGSV